MPSALEHQSWSDQNEAFYRDVLGGSHSANPDWAMTVLFYSAMHAVEAALVHTSTSGKGGHKERKQALDNNGWQTISGLYSGLYTKSIDSRYRCVRPSQAQLAFAELTLQQIRQEIITLGARPS